MYPHAFSVDEANALLPHVRATLRRIDARVKVLRRHADGTAVLKVLWGDQLISPDNPDHEELVAHQRAMARTERSIERLVHEGLTERGIRFPPGGVEHGLVDFPSTLDGRWIHLCWQSGEPRVAYWHELTAGYAGRQPITPDLAQRMGS